MKKKLKKTKKKKKKKLTNHSNGIFLYFSKGERLNDRRESVCNNEINY